MDKICNIYFNPIELNGLDFISKLDFDFTDQRRISDLGMHDYTIQGRLIDEKLSNLVLQFGIVDKNIKPIQLPIDEIKTLVTYFHHQFVIKNNNLELVNQDVFSSIKNELTFTNPEPKADNVNQRISELESELAQVKNQLIRAKAELAGKPADDDDDDDDKELNTKSQNYAAKVVLAMAQIADLNLDSPYASKEPNTTNSIIFDQIKTNGMKVSNQVIGNWLKLATEQSKDD